MSDRRRKAWGSPAAECFGAGLFLAYVVFSFVRAGPPSLTDYANWTYQGVLLARHLHGIPDSAHVLKLYPVPNSTVTVGIGLLAWLLPWTIAAKVWLALQLGLSFATIRHLARTLQVSSAVWLIVPPAVFFGVDFWYGFASFELGLAWTLLLASVLLRRMKDVGGGDWTIGLLLLCTFFTHMIPFAFCCLMLLLYARQTGERRVLWQLVPATLLSAWYGVGRYFFADNADGKTGMLSSVRNYSTEFWAYKVNSYAKSFGWVNPSDAHGSLALGLFGKSLFTALLALEVLLCFVLGWCIVQAGRSAWKRCAPERFLWAAIVWVMPLYAFAPVTALGVSDPGSRLLQAALAVALVLCCSFHSKVLWGAGCAMSVLGIAGIVLFAEVGFGGRPPVLATALPDVVTRFGHVPFQDQDFYYRDLVQGDYREKIFPTGIFLNK